MTQEQCKSVVDTMHLPGGIPWSIPVALSTTRENAAALKEGQEIALTTPSGQIVGILETQSIYTPDKDDEAEKVYRTQDLSIERENGGYRVDADPSESGRLNRIAADAGILLRRVEPRSETLEDIFLGMTDGQGEADRTADAA